MDSWDLGNSIVHRSSKAQGPDVKAKVCSLKLSITLGWPVCSENTSLYTNIFTALQGPTKYLLLSSIGSWPDFTRKVSGVADDGLKQVPQASM